MLKVFVKILLKRFFFIHVKFFLCLCNCMEPVSWKSLKENEGIDCKSGDFAYNLD